MKRWHPTGLLIGCLTVLGTLPAQAQQFDFTPAGSAPKATDPTVPVIPILPKAQTGVQPTQPIAPAQPTVTQPLAPTQPIAAPAQPIVPVTTANPAATSPIPVVAPSSITGSVDPSDPYTYRRIPGAGPAPSLPASRGQIATGTVIPLTVYREITFPPYQAISANLQVTDPVLDRFGQVVIPAGSVIWGTFEPVLEDDIRSNLERSSTTQRDRVIGSRFVANRLTIQTSTYQMNGQSNLLSVGVDPKADVGTVAARGAGYGAVGGLALGVLTGGFGFLPILAGGLAGAAAGTTNVDQVITLKPNTVVTVQLGDNLIVQ